MEQICSFDVGTHTFIQGQSRDVKAKFQFGDKDGSVISLMKALHTLVANRVQVTEEMFSKARIKTALTI